IPSAIGPTSPRSPFWAELEKLPAVTFVSLSIVFLYLALSRLTTRTWALLLSLLYAFGTSSLSVSSQAQWQHGASQLALCAAFYCLLRGKNEPKWIGYAGFPFAMSLLCRPTDILLVVPCALYILFYHPKQVPKTILTALPPVVFQLWYNHTYFG